MERGMDGFAAFDLLPDVVTVLDSNLTIRHVNSVCESILGYPPEHLVGQSVVAYIPEQQLADAAEAVAFNVEGRSRGRPAIFSIVGADGQQVPLEAIARPFESSAGEVLVAIVLRPVTNRNLTVEERRALEGLIAMTAAECLSAEADGALDAVAVALNRYSRVLGTDLTELVVDGDARVNGEMERS
jgi:PAS domain S-box-containing protein